MIRIEGLAPINECEVLDLDTLRPGDIIVSRPREIESTLIAFFGWSVFSHANLVVPEEVLGGAPLPPGQPNTLLFEATTDTLPGTGNLVGGVGYFRLPRKMIRKRDSKIRPIGRVCPLKRFATFEVFRHQAESTPEFQNFLRKQLPELCARYQNEPYASLRDLAKTSIQPSIVQVVGYILQIVPKSPRAGFFCSQLVATLLRDGGFPLNAKKPSLTTPGDIAESPNLVCVTSSTRRQLAENEELVGLEHLLSQAIPDAFSNLEPAIRDRRLLPSDDKDSDFRGRLTSWGMRDRLETSMQRVKALLSSQEAITKITHEILAQQVDSGRQSGAETV